MNNIDRNLIKLKEIADFTDLSSVQQQENLINNISESSNGLIILLELLIKRQKKKALNISYTDSIIYKYIYNCRVEALQKKLDKYLAQGIVKLESEHNIDYTPLYKSLVSNNFKHANKLTQEYLNTLAQIDQDKKRQWLYFTDIFNIPITDIITIDKLWRIYSLGKFGFSVQRKIWLYNNKDWEKFWHTIGWKINKKNLRYPDEFTWTNNAPYGHLPLFNQLRGVQVLASLFIHPAWRVNKNVADT